MNLLVLQAAEKLVWYIKGRRLEILGEKEYQQLDDVWYLLDQILTPMYIGMPRTGFKRLLHDEYIKGWCGCGCYIEPCNNPGLCS